MSDSSATTAAAATAKGNRTHAEHSFIRSCLPECDKIIIMMNIIIIKSDNSFSGHGIIK